VTARAKLRSDLVLVEQTYRGEQSYIVKDPETRKYFRFRPVEVVVMQVLDGEHTHAEASAALAEEGLKVSPAGVEAFAAKLKKMGLCERTLNERSVLQMERLRAERRRKVSPSLFQGDLMRMRWSVGDPDNLFDRWLPRLRFFFSRTFLVLSVVLFAVYLLVLGIMWPEFTSALADLYSFNFDAGTLAVFWLTGTAIIVVHELGHGMTCKYFGGQVHEIGAMLIYFEPAFYCNVNDAWTFPELRARLWVTAAGSWIQLVIASLAAIVWWAAEPGTLVYEVAFAGVLIGGATTVLMNANPLIPLDGYYALSDYLEVPNLRQRALARISWLIKSKVFRLELPEPQADAREKQIFLIYGALALGYIGLILTFFAATAYHRLSDWLGATGVFIFLTAAFFMLRSPVKAWVGTARAALRQHRAAWRSGRRPVIIGAAAVLLLGAVIPGSITVTGPFVTASTSASPLTAPDSGIIHRVLVREGTRVAAGAPLIQIRNIALERQMVASRRVRDSLALQSAEARGRERFTDLALLDADRAIEDARLKGLSETESALHIRSLRGGTVLTQRPEELLGRWVSSGEVILQVADTDSLEIRIRIRGAGGTQIRPGNQARLLSDATLHGPSKARVSEVSAAATSPEQIEARLRIAASDSWRPGVTGRASITIRDSNLWGALWWAIRRAVRTDILL
jgi:hypothetical protein